MKIILTTFALFLLWYVLGMHPTFHFFISDPISVFLYFVGNYKQLTLAFFTTFFEAAFGLLLAIISSYFFAIMCQYFPRLLSHIRGIFIVTQVLPIITLAPLFIILFGMGIISKMAMVTLMCFFPVFMSIVDGMNRVKYRAEDFLELYGATPKYRIFKVYLPISLPTVFIGIKVAATMAVLGAIVAEFLGAHSGLGKNLSVAPKRSEAELLMASAILTAMMGVAIFKIVSLTQRYLTKWDYQNQ